VKQVPAEMQDMARGLFKKKHKEENASYGTSEFPMYILAVIQDVYFVGGYGTVKWVNAKDYAACSPDKLCDRRYADPLQQINLLNNVFREAIPKMFEVLERATTAHIQKCYPSSPNEFLLQGCTKGKIIGVDSGGIDLRLQLHDVGHVLLQRVRFHCQMVSTEPKARLPRSLRVDLKVRARAQLGSVIRREEIVVFFSSFGRHCTGRWSAVICSHAECVMRHSREQKFSTAVTKERSSTAFN
jgi:hypothetical protein